MTEPSKSIPTHVAIIMDGNGRWATQRGLPRGVGHKQGAEAVERTVRAAADLGIKYLTLFAFSTENWQRPAEEVTDLMGLLRLYLRSKTAEMHQNNVRLKIIGQRDKLSADILASIEYAENLTKENTCVCVQIALSYSGRWDLTQAMQQIAAKIAAGTLKEDQITQETITAHLSTAGIPDPDLLIRTSGELRISNFLLWQGAYSEYVFTETFWPDFGLETLTQAVTAYQNRERRFGTLVTKTA